MPWRLASRQTESAPTRWGSSEGGDPAVDGVVGVEARSVRCECCGMAEECTPTYIGRVRERFQGKWVCGLCAEAVKERQAREPSLTVGGAVAAHAAMCERFNSTVRLNPKLSLASSMRDIARKSSMRRSWRNSVDGGGVGATATPPSACGGDKLSRANSCALPYV
ncbi:unnamed protein product [Miscanthus lutarioriparius]|uniref:DUF1677 family protein n=1 Tax=Miscanthus lutarioriparius TaxID=422564 RepID=A0A811RWB4_9POAL|nr:unnamed protein product [Miscanthus lutarioriparius]CAD6333174.1 unnamed protein product [Miscanthus lutarioriparius]